MKAKAMSFLTHGRIASVMTSMLKSSSESPASNRKVEENYYSNTEHFDAQSSVLRSPQSTSVRPVYRERERFPSQTPREAGARESSKANKSYVASAEDALENCNAKSVLAASVHHAGRPRVPQVTHMSLSDGTTRYLPQSAIRVQPNDRSEGTRRVYSKHRPNSASSSSSGVIVSQPQSMSQMEEWPRDAHRGRDSAPSTKGASSGQDDRQRSTYNRQAHPQAMLPLEIPPRRTGTSTTQGIPVHSRLETAHVKHRIAPALETNMNISRQGQQRRVDIKPFIHGTTDEDSRNTRQIPSSPRLNQLRREGTPTRNPVLGVAFPRPHSFDVPENKPKIQRTLSAPNLKVSSIEELCNSGKPNQPCPTNNYYNNSSHGCDQPDRRSFSKDNIEVKGTRSRSLPVGANLKKISVGNWRRVPLTDADPLRYFAYLGKRFQFRDRRPSTQNIYSARPVILASTSVIAPQVTNTFCQQLEEKDVDYLHDYPEKHQGACHDLIDCCTCMCCVKALFYHCTKDGDSVGTEHPCSCYGPGTQCVGRWSILGLLSIAMPCLLCYLPIEGCQRGIDYFRRKSKNTTDEQ